MLASDRDREGPARRARPRLGAARLRGQRAATARGGAMTVDALTFLGDSIFGSRVDAATLLATLDRAGVERAVACPVKPRGYHLAAANDAVAEAVRSHPERLLGVARVDPLLGDDA